MIYQCPVCGQRGGSPLRSATVPWCSSRRHVKTVQMRPVALDEIPAQGPEVCENGASKQSDPGAAGTARDLVSTPRRSRR